MNADPRGVAARVHLVWLSLAHAAVDAYALIVPFLLPILLTRLAPVDRRPLYAGVFAAANAVATSLGQVGFAFLADRRRNAAFMWGGLAAASVGMSLVGLSSSIGIAFLWVLFCGLGVAAFHPQAAVAAGNLPLKGRGAGISVFITSGNVGQTIGPFLLIYALTQWGTSAFAPAMIPGLLFAAALIPASRRMLLPETRPRERKKITTPIPYRPMTVLFLLVVLRTVTFTGFLNFMSVYLSDTLGLSDVPRAGVMSVFIFSGSMGMLLGGSLSDRLPRLRLLWGSLLLPVPLLLASLHTQGFWFVAALSVGNFIYQFSTPIYIVMGQETMPERENVASSLMMGAAWGTAGLLALPIGAIANVVGLGATLTGLALLPLGSSLLLFLVPRRQEAEGNFVLLARE